jgi:hypothetical protein
MLLYVHHFIVNWAITLLIETPIFILLVRCYFKILAKDISLSRLILGGIFASTITIPWVWFIFPVLFYNSIPLAVAIAEVLTFIVEAVFYWLAFRLPWRQAIIISFFANLASFAIGSLLKL